MTKEMTQEITAVQKYEIDKKYELQNRKLDEVSNIAIGNSNIAAISLMAEKFSKAGDMIPKEFQGQAEKCFAAIYKGATLGLDAFASLQRIAVVNGRATIWGDAALAVVKNTGKLEHFKEYYGIWASKNDLTKEELESPENQEMIKKFNGIVRKTACLDFSNKKFGAGCELKRKGEELIFQFFTVEDATTAGLWGTNVWKKYPQRMIMYRPRAYALRDAFPDVLEGLYLKEEMEGEEIKDITPKSKTALAHSIPPALERSFNVSELKNPIQDIKEPVQVDIEEVIEQVQEVDNREVIKETFQRVKDGLEMIKAKHGIENFWNRSAAEDLKYLKENDEEIYGVLVELKDERLGALK